MKHLYFDCETLGHRDNTIIASFAAAVFDFDDFDVPYDEYVKTGFFVKLNISEQKADPEHSVCKEAVNWWLTQPKDAQRRSILPHPDDVSPHVGWKKFETWLKKESGYDFKNSWILSRGVAFDFPKLEFNMKKYLGREAVNGWKVRDTRTYVDIFTGSTNGVYKIEEPEGFVKHHALHDVCYDIKVLQTIHRKVKNGEDL